MVHKDFFGQQLTVGDMVVTSATFKPFDYSRVIRFTKKMVRINVLSHKKPTEKTIYAKDCIKIDESLVIFKVIST